MSKDMTCPRSDPSDEQIRFRFDGEICRPCRLRLVNDKISNMVGLHHAFGNRKLSSLLLRDRLLVLIVTPIHPATTSPYRRNTRTHKITDSLFLDTQG
jgi:hypothetical protein